MPFAQATEMLAFFTRAAAVRRVTEGAGAAYEAVQTAAVETIERELPPDPLGPRVQLLSADGAMVPLRHQQWAEVKTLALGAVGPPVQERGEWVVHTEQLSYVSRLADAATFGRLALVETHRRGTETAKTVCAVSDGAEWIQGFVDLHRPDAVHILDFPHALSYVAQAGQAVYGESTAGFTRWFACQRQLARRQAKAPMPLATLQPEPPLALATAPTERSRPTPRRSPPSTPTVHKASKGPYRPPPNYPWRRFHISWRGDQHTQIVAFAKL